MDQLHVTNTLTNKKEIFEPLNAPFVGMYECGPTVYGDPHLGHARPAITFDLVNRFLRHVGYKVRYVKNITDVGHLENDADEGEDKLQKKARVEQLEPMEVAQYYTNRYRDFMNMLNVIRPDIEPTASGHIPEQIQIVKEIIKNGYGYEVNGSVYFDVPKYNQDYNYGKLSGRNLDDIIAGGGDRVTKAQLGEKRHPADFALWKSAPAEHIMKWNSPWGIGFPGWHVECTAMSTKYLGKKYDIHGGGMDLIFPHHEAEICQSNAVIGDPHSHENDEAKYWIHNNMITINGKKMGKSLGNFITLEELFTGSHKLLEQVYSPMTIRFFILQAHYGGTLDFSNEALQAAEKAHKRTSDVYNRLNAMHFKAGMPIEHDEEKENLIKKFGQAATAAMNDDFNTAKVLARIFEICPIVNAIHNGKGAPTDANTMHEFRETFNQWYINILGLVPLEESASVDAMTDELMDLMIELRKTAREEKNWSLSDKIRDGLGALNIKLKDTPHGTEWNVEN